METRSSSGRVLGRLWQADARLTASGLVMLAALVAFLVAVVVDPRQVTGAPAWLKPAKFAASTGLYMLTLAWIFSYLQAWPRLRRVVGGATVVVFVLEVVVIAFQAWRGRPSHFNVATGFDAVLFAVMGSAILTQTALSAAVVVALWRQSFADRGLGWALRLGFALTFAGAMTGGLMTRPTAEQRAWSATNQPIAIGAHTVGAPDGGAGLTGTGWSTEHGDLRVPHFIGLHAVQALPLVAWLLGRRRVPERARVRAVIAAATSYAGLFAILLAQALAGQSVVRPDGFAAVALAVWAVGTVAAVAWTLRGGSARNGHRSLGWARS